MVTRKSEWMAMIKPIIDRESAKKDALALAKELEGVLNVNIDATPENISELTKIFNQQLREIGKQPIVFSEQTLKGVVSQFTKAIAQGAVAGMNSGVQAGSGKSLQQLQTERDRLAGEQRSLRTRNKKLNDVNDFAYNLSDAETNEARAFNSSEIAKMKATALKTGRSFDSFILQMKASVEELQIKMSNLKVGTSEYDTALINFYEKSFDLFRMSKTLSNNPSLVQDKTILEDYSFDNLKYMFADDIDVNVESFDAAIKRSYQSLANVGTKLKEIDAELQTIQSRYGVINAAEAKNGLKTVDEITAAYERLKSKKSAALKDQNLLHLNSALQYEPKATDGIQTFAKKYNEAAISGDWVEQYHALLRYVKLYESYLNSENKAHRNKVTKKNNPYTQLYEQLKPMAENAQNMLQNIVNAGEGKPFVGMAAEDAEKTAAANRESANATKNESEAEAKARVESEAKAKADQESAKAESNAKAAAEGKAKANVESAAAAEKDRVASEAAARANITSASGGILNNSAYANLFGKARGEAEGKRVAAESSAAAAKDELSATQQTTAELEKQQKLLLYRRVDGAFDPNRISSISTDALYDKSGTPIIQQALQGGFGGFGDGLYGAIARASADLIPPIAEGKTSFFEFDVSGYNLFVNKTLEQAQALQSFLLSLQKFVGAGSILDVSQLTNIADLSQDQLFEEAQKIFKNFSMSKSQFDAWIENAKKESEMIAKMFANGQVPANRHNFGTRFMQELGYDGVLNNTGDLDYDGNYHGSVIYDPDVDKIKNGFAEGMKTFSNADDFAAYLERQAVAANNAASAQDKLNQSKSQEPKPVDDTAQTNNETGATTQQIQSYEQLCKVVEKYNQLVAQGIKTPADIDAFNDVADQLDGVVSEDQLDPSKKTLLDVNTLAQQLGIEIPQAAQQAEGAINGVVAAQEKLNGTEAQNPPAQDDTGIHNANAAAIEKEARAQEKLNSLNILDLYYAAKHPEIHPGELEGALQNNPNLVSDLTAQRDALKQKMQPVNDMASRISKMSSIKNIPFDDLYQEAANVGRQLSTMYDDGIRDTEEYVALQYKLINIFEKLSVAYGGVKGSGSKDRSQLYQWLGDSVQQRTGYNPMQDGRAVDAIWGQDTYSIAETANKMFGLKEMAAKMLNYNGLEGLGLKIDTEEISQLNFIIDALSKLQQSSGAAKTSVDGLNDSLQQKNTIENADNGGAEASEENAETQAIQQQNQALQENLDLKTKTNAQTGTTTGVGAVQGGVVTDGGADVSAEASQLTNLQNVIAAATTAVGAKTQAFTAEEAEVKRVVASEIGSLGELEQKLLTIKGTLEGLLSNLKTGQSDIGAGLSNVTVNVNKTDGADAEQKGSWALDTTVQSVRTSLDGVRTDLGNVISAIGNINTQPTSTGADVTLATEATLGSVKAVLDAINGKIVTGTKGGSGKQSEGSTDGSSEKKTSKSSKKTKSKSSEGQDEADQLKKIASLEADIGKLRGKADNATNERVKQALEEEIRLRERLIQLIKDGSAMSEEDEARQRTDLSEKTNAARKAAAEEEKAQKKAIADQQKAEKKAYDDFVKETRKEAGMAQAQSTINKAGGTLKDAALIDNASPEATAKFKQLDAALKQLNATYTEINSKPGPVDPEDQQRLIAQRENVQQLQGAVAQLVEEHQRLNGVNAQQIGTTSLGLGASSESQQKAITDAVMAATKGRAAIKGFNADTNELTYTLKTGTNQFTTFKAAIDRTNGSIMAVRGNTTQAAGVFATLGKKIKEYSYYFTGSMMIYRAIAWVREGITAIKDIDTALTELKKVTDATNESYENFLDTAAKTADKVGSTIKEVVSSTADWARLNI